jgi:spore coat polysaccharide biosynthesis protein SpsF
MTYFIGKILKNKYFKKKVVAIIQARMNSTRLPGKVLKKILNKTMLEYLIERIESSDKVDELIIATTQKKTDDLIHQFCEDNSLNCFRGSESDVLARYYHTAKYIKADYIVRICADSPLIDTYIIDELIDEFLLESSNYDYLSNTINQTYPLGMNMEIFNMRSLEEAHQNAESLYEREHVTPYIYNHSDEFKIMEKHLDEDMSFLRLTVDQEEDFQLISYIIENLYTLNPNYRLSDIISLYKDNPSIFKINSNIKQTIPS